jgi:hypothetical protein
MESPVRRFSYSNVMSTAAMLFALCAFVTGSVSAKGKTKPLPTNSVGSKQLKTNAVNGVDVAPSAIDTGKIKEGAVGATQLGQASVLGSKLANNAVTGEKVAPDAIGTEQIADSLPAVGVQGEFDTPIDEGGNSPVSFVYEEYDTAGMHDDTPDTDLVVPTDGVYLFTGTTYWSPSQATNGVRKIVLDVYSSSGDYSPYSSESAYDVTSAPWSVALGLEAGDVINLRVVNDASGPNAGDGDTVHTTDVNMIWIAPGPA